MLTKRIVTLLLILSLSTFVFNQQTLADVQSNSIEYCPVYDPLKIFDGGEYYSVSWYPSNITWGFAQQEISGLGSQWGQNSAKISREPSKLEREIIKEAFQSWDRALDTIQFTESVNPRIEIGFIEGGNHSFIYNWLFRQSTDSKKFINQGSIGFNSLDTKIINEGYFSAVAHRRIANILGMGFIETSNPNDSVVKGDLDYIYNRTKGLSLKNIGSRYIPTNYEIGLLRSLYGESTCPSTFGLQFDVERAQQAKVNADLEEARKNFEDAKARADVEAKTTTKKLTISCVKGKTVKKVTAINPRCPSGYKKS